MGVVRRIARSSKSFSATALRVVPSVALVLVGALGVSGAASSSSGAVVAPSTQLLDGSLAPVPFGDTLIGPAASTAPLTLQVTLYPRDPAALAAMAEAVSTPGTAQFHQFLSVGQFAQLYGPTGRRRAPTSRFR